MNNSKAQNIGHKLNLDMKQLNLRVLTEQRVAK